MHPLLNLLYGVGRTPVNSKERLGGQRLSCWIGPWVVQGRLVTREWPCQGAQTPHRSIRPPQFHDTVSNWTVSPRFAVSLSPHVVSLRF